MKRLAYAAVLGAILSCVTYAATVTIPPQTVTVTIPAQTVTVTVPAQTVTVPDATTPPVVVTPPVVTPPVTTPPAAGTFWVYQNGVFNWGGDYDFVLTSNYTDTAATFAGHKYDLKNTTTGAWGGWLPYAGNTVPLWAMDVTAYKSFTIAIRPTAVGQKWSVYFVKVNDVALPASCTVADLAGEFGAAPVGVYTTYTIPFSRLCIGAPAGVPTVYKFAVQDQSGRAGSVTYVDNVGFVP